jgi:hypothetical protein
LIEPPCLKKIVALRREEHTKHPRPIGNVPNNRPDDCLGRVHMHVVELGTVLPSAMNDFRSDGVTGLDFVVKVRLVFRIVGKEVRYAIAEARRDARQFRKILIRHSRAGLNPAIPESPGDSGFGRTRTMGSGYCSP